MTLSGPGGKIDVGEDPLTALRREIKEEVGFTVPDDAVIIPSHVEPTVSGDYSIQWYVIHLLDAFDPSPPPSELGKVVDPQWYPFAAVDLERFAPTTRAAFLASRPYFYRALAARNISGANARWLRRDALTLPDNYDLHLINNKDRLCPAYVVNALTGKEFDYAQLDADLAPDASYSIFDLVDDPDEWAIFDAAAGRWVLGDPTTCKYHALWSPNPPYAHFDGLRPAVNAARPTDVVYYPQGRSPKQYDYDSLPDEVRQYATTIAEQASQLVAHSDRARVYIDTVTDCYEKFTLLEPQGQYVWLETARSAIAFQQSTSEEKPPSPPSQEPLVPAVAPPSTFTDYGRMRVHDAPLDFKNTQRDPILLTGHSARDGQPLINLRTMAHIASLTRPDLGLTELTQLDDNFVTLETLVPPQFGDVASATANLADALLIGNKNLTTTVSHDLIAQTSTVTTRLKDKGSQIAHTERLSHIMGPARHTEVLRPNVVPYTCAENVMELSREVETIMGEMIEARSVANAVALLVTTTKDAENTSFSPLYERLWAGYFAVSTGCRPAGVGQQRPVPGATAVPPPGVDPRYVALCPNKTGFTSMFIPAYIPPGPAPAVRAPPANFPTVAKTDGVSGCIILPTRRYYERELPPITAVRDFRAVLFYFTGRFLGLQTPLSMRPAGAAHTEANYPFQSSHIEPYRARLPPLVCLSTNPGDMWNQQPYAPAQYLNPQSWLDAIGFLLKYHGNLDSCMSAYTAHLRRSAMFPSVAVHNAATPLFTRLTTGADLLLSLRRRLVYLRMVRTNLDFNVADAVLGIADDALWPPIWNCRDPVGVPLDHATLIGPAGAQGLAICADVYAHPAFAIGDVPPIAQFAANVQPEAKRDIAWHAYFANVVIDGSDTDPLFDFVTCLPTSVVDSMRGWLALPFVPHWANWGVGGPAPTANMLLNGPDWSVPYVNRNAALAVVAANAHEHYCNGNEYDLDFQLPVHNLCETFAVHIPAGITDLYNILHMGAEYHADQGALLMFNHLCNSIPLGRPLEIGVLLQIQMRAGIDSIVQDFELNCANIMTNDGSVTTGNQDLDIQLTNRRQYDGLGMNSFQQSTYVLACAGSLQSMGLPDTLVGELTIGTELRWINPKPWRYFTRGPFTDNDTALLRWHGLTPIGRNIFRPDIKTPLCLLSERPLAFTPVTQETEVIWDDWSISTPGHEFDSPLGALRCVLAASGHIVQLEPTVRYLHNSANMLPRPFSILTCPGRVGPRHPSGTPSAITTLRDPLWDYSTVISPYPQVKEINGEFVYIRPGPVHGFMCQASISTFPPTAMVTPVQIHQLRGNTANPRPHALSVAALLEYGANALLPTNALMYGGMYPANHSLPFYDLNGQEQDELRLTIPWFSRQASANPLFMRSWASFSRWNPIEAAMHSRVAPLTGPNGVVPPAPYGRAANAGMAINPSAVLLYNVPLGIDIPPAQYIQLVNLQCAAFLQRWKTWYLAPKIDITPVIITDLRRLLDATDSLGADAVLSARNARYLDDIDAKYAPIAERFPAFPARLAIRPPGIPSSLAPSVSIAPPQAVGPSVRRDQLHFMTGFSGEHLRQKDKDALLGVAAAQVTHEQAASTVVGQKPVPGPLGIGRPAAQQRLNAHTPSRNSHWKLSGF
jgi:ADP-ribose pyrophosphatase YjhB (NUDIX family)